MKTRHVLAPPAALLLAGVAHAVSDKIDLMPGGVLCDRGDQICYDQRGASVERTREMFGRYAADAVQKKHDKKISKHLFESPVPTPR